uniref:Thioredoxin domain-containing protein n=1 Tax=Parascaris univalens TaxID=6257 RepID=A0A914ZQK7_PARUN
MNSSFPLKFLTAFTIVAFRWKRESANWSPEKVAMLKTRLRVLLSRLLLPTACPEYMRVPLRLGSTLTSTSSKSISGVTLLKTTSSTRYQKGLFVSRRFNWNESAETPGYIFKVENDEQFAEMVINSSVPVLVDFYADWCGPCQMLAPRIEAKVVGRHGLVSLAKVNVDYAADLAMDYEVRAVPTVIAFKGGEQVGRFEGDHGDAQLDEFIDNLLQS